MLSSWNCAEFTEDEKLDTMMGCHVRALQYFGGTTKTSLYDNMKTGVDENSPTCRPYLPQISVTTYK